jgi:hypothetical protein
MNTHVSRKLDTIVVRLAPVCPFSGHSRDRKGHGVNGERQASQPLPVISCLFAYSIESLLEFYAGTGDCLLSSRFSINHTKSARISRHSHHAVNRRAIHLGEPGVLI